MDDVCKEIFTMSLTLYKFFTLAFFAESMINAVYLHVILDFLNFASTISERDCPCCPHINPIDSHGHSSQYSEGNSRLLQGCEYSVVKIRCNYPTLAVRGDSVRSE